MNTTNGNGIRKDHGTKTTTSLLVFCWLVVAICLASGWWRNADKAPATTFRHFIDPNHAPWWELTALPEIGPALARQIVSHRDTYRAGGEASFDEDVFRSLSDLDAVRGIGPKTIARLAPHLRFDVDSLSQPPGPLNDHRQPQ